MSLYKKTLQEISKNKILREEGKDISIPSPFSRMSSYWPGIQQGKYYLVSAGQKVGKTQITDYVFVYHPFNYVYNNPNTNIKLKVFDFNLEMSRGAKFRQLIVHRIYQKTGKIFSTRELDSIFKDSILPDNILRFIEEDHEWFEAFENTVEYIDDIRNPWGIMKHLRSFFEDNGSYTYRTIKEKVENADGSITTKDKQIVDYYTPNNPDLFVIVKVDNINLLTPEKGSTIYDAIQMFSSEHMLRVRDRWNGIPVIIQQQALSKEGNDSIKLGRTRASADGLADNKATSRDCNVFMGLYSPYRTGQDTYNNYNIKSLKDHYRSFYIDFDRDGAACETNLYFHGAVTQFKELPKYQDMTKQMYDNIHVAMNGNINN